MEIENNSEFISENPLSPVLCNAKLNRKLLIGRRTRRKSKTSLLDKFEDSQDSLNQSQNLEILGGTEEDVNKKISELKNKTNVEQLILLEEIDKQNKLVAKSLSLEKVPKLDVVLFKKPTGTPVKKVCVKEDPIEDTFEQECSKENSDFVKTECSLFGSANDTNKGFITARGKSIQILEKESQKAIEILGDILGNNGFNRPRKYSYLKRQQNASEEIRIDVSFEGFAKTDIDAAKFKLESLQNILNDIKTLQCKPKSPNFMNANSKTEMIESKNRLENKDISDLNTSLRTCQVLENVEKQPSFSEPIVPQNTNSFGFSTAAGKTIDFNKDRLKKFESMFADLGNTDLSENNQSTSVAFNNTTEPTVVEAPNKKCETMFKNIEAPLQELPKNETNFGFSTAGGSSIKVSKETMKKYESMFDQDTEIKTIDTKAPQVKPSPLTTPFKSHRRITALDEIDSPISKRPRLSHNNFRSNPIENDKIEKIKNSIFGGINFDDLNSSKPASGFSSPYKKPSIIHSSTPVKTANNSIKFASPRPAFKSENNCTPLQTLNVSKEFSIRRPFDASGDAGAPLVIKKRTEGNTLSWIEELNNQRLTLEHQLRVVNEKQNALISQTYESVYSQRYGTLYDSKKLPNRLGLKKIAGQEFGSSSNAHRTVLHITPQNAELVHLRNLSSNATITTIDGATVVPNPQNLIGVSEIEASFKKMPGVQEKLIPNGWIKNHYKWIVWKLASYERFLPKLQDSLNVENIIKQLKFRYDKEIYDSKRPALRKIFEQDDVPQKRMVLCVSNILKTEDLTQLELTDGWYSIKCLIDEALSRQVSNKKIKIGFKIIVSGAELVNGEACHPLEFETSDKVRLKIAYNSTRRAEWSTKLGYQKCPLPFVIPLDSVNPSGGSTGCLKVFLCRIYPMQYMEKTQSNSVWRNQKAEDRHAQNFENNKFKNIENQTAPKVTDRNVTPVLKIRIINAFGTNQSNKYLTIWRPNQYHLETLKENAFFLIYNVSVRFSGDLSTTSKTRFTKITEEHSNYEKFKRKLIKISDLDEEKLTFKEFDTVGVVLEVHIEESRQHLWLIDAQEKLMLVKIYDGINTCCILDGLKKGNIISLANLIFCDIGIGFNQAIANQFTSVLKYPQLKLLQEGIKELENFEGLPSIIESGCNKIEELKKDNRFYDKVFSNLKKNSSAQDDSKLNYSQITSTDIAMSEIDIEQFIR